MQTTKESISDLIILGATNQELMLRFRLGINEVIKLRKIIEDGLNDDGLGINKFQQLCEDLDNLHSL